MNIKDLIKDNFCTFDSYRAGFMYYVIQHLDESYRFSIPLDDVGNATLSKTEKAITLMRWIRKSIDNNEFIKL